MKKIVNLILLMALCVGTFWSQNSPLTTTEPECGTDEILVRNPFLQQLYAERVACAPEVDLDTAQVLTLPIVFHIIHLGEAIGEGTNISDEQILSCVENLNHRFRGDVEALAALTDEYDENELSLVIDSKIEFCLAVRDPEGNSTNGINRINGTSITYNGESYADDGIAMTSTNSGIIESYLKSEVGCWDVDKYINFYVVSEINGNNGGNGIQGYAYLGPTNNCLDGLVCLYNVVGTEGNLKSTHNLNTTVTHEMGHHLSLYHTFWLSSDCTPETNSCSQGDQCPDTPKTTSNSGCSPNDCPDAMVENYMDYTSQNCRTAFTQNQIERMRDQIWESRNGYIYNNLTCQPIDGIDIAISNVTLPSSWCQPTIDFSIKITNFGGQNIFGAELSINGVVYPLPPLSAGEFTTIGFTNFTIGDGIFNFELLYPEDQYLNNNTVTSIVNVTNDAWVEVSIMPDVWSNEIYWELANEDGILVMEGGNYPIFSQGETFTQGGCLPEDCYAFIITDIANDGMGGWYSDDYPQPGYQITVDNTVVINYLNPPFNLPNSAWSERSEEFCVSDCLTSYCPWDLNGDGVVAVADLMIFLEYNGQQGECFPADFNFSGVVDSQDLMDIIDWYGYDCTTGTFLEGLIVPDWVWSYLDNTNIFETNNVYPLNEITYIDFLGHKVNDKARLTPGIYLVIEKWSNGTITTRKEFRLQ